MRPEGPEADRIRDIFNGDHEPPWKPPGAGEGKWEWVPDDPEKPDRIHGGWSWREEPGASTAPNAGGGKDEPGSGPVVDPQKLRDLFNPDHEPPWDPPGAGDGHWEWQPDDPDHPEDKEHGGWIWRPDPPSGPGPGQLPVSPPPPGPRGCLPVPWGPRPWWPCGCGGLFALVLLVAVAVAGVAYFNSSRSTATSNRSSPSLGAAPSPSRTPTPTPVPTPRAFSLNPTQATFQMTQGSGGCQGFPPQFQMQATVSAADGVLTIVERVSPTQTVSGPIQPDGTFRAVTPTPTPNQPPAPTEIWTGRISGSSVTGQFAVSGAGCTETYQLAGNIQ